MNDEMPPDQEVPPKPDDDKTDEDDLELLAQGQRPIRPHPPRATQDEGQATEPEFGQPRPETGAPASDPDPALTGLPGPRKARKSLAHTLRDRLGYRVGGRTLPEPGQEEGIRRLRRRFGRLGPHARALRRLRRR